MQYKDACSVPSVVRYCHLIKLQLQLLEFCLHLAFFNVLKIFRFNFDQDKYFSVCNNF